MKNSFNNLSLFSIKITKSIEFYILCKYTVILLILAFLIEFDAHKSEARNISPVLPGSFETASSPNPPFKNLRYHKCIIKLNCHFRKILTCKFVILF